MKPKGSTRERPSPKTHSIVTQVTCALISTVLISLAAVGGVLISLSSRSEFATTIRLEQAIAQVASVKINAHMDDLNRKVTYLARVRGFSAFDASAQNNLLEALLNQNMSYETVGLVDGRGMLMRFRSTTGETVPKDWSDTTAFRRSYQTQEDYIGPVELREGDDEPTLLLTVPIRDPQNKVDGLLFARIKLAYLWSILDEAAIGESGYAYLLDRRGFLMMESGGRPKHFAFVDLSQRPIGKVLREFRPGTTQTYVGLHDIPVLGQISRVELMNWTVIVELPMHELLTPLYRMVAIMGAILLGALAISLLISLVIARRIADPFRQLVDAVTSLQVGKLEIQVAVVRNDEIGRLAKAFNHMVQRLNADIAEHGRLERERRASDARLALILETVPDGVAVINAEGRITYANSTAERILGLSRNAISLREYDDPSWKISSVDGGHFDPDGLPFNLVMRTGQAVFGIEHAIETPDGKRTILSINAAPLTNAAHDTIEVITTIADITKRFQAEETLRKTQERLSEAHQLAQIGVWEWEIATDTVVWSPELYAIGGLDPSQAAPSFKDHHKFYSPASWDALQATVARSLASAEPYQLELELIRPDGSIRHVKAFGGVKLGADGQARSLFGTVQDITEKIEAEEKIRAALRQNELLLGELQHRAKNSFSMISSMIKLSCITGANPGATSALEELDMRVMSVAELYSYLYSSGSFTELRLDEYLVRVAAALVGLSNNVTLATDMEPTHAPTGNAAPLGLIVTELITNAVKYAFPGKRPGTVSVSLRSTGSLATLEVKDDGIGLPAGFDLAANAGMGLQLIQGLAGQINGEFKMQNAAPGTRCVLVFPLAREK